MWSVVQNIWPISAFVYNELRASDVIVKKLPIPDSTKHFVYAIRDPESQAVIYVLAVQNLSERSATDAECLIKEIRPDAVVVQVGHLNNSMSEGLIKDAKNGGKNDKLFDGDSVPTSVFEVLKKCLMCKINQEKYEDVAGNLVLTEIFGVGFNGHFITAKKAAEEVGSSFFMLESPLVKCSTENTDGEVLNLGTESQNAFALRPSGLASRKMGSSNISLNSIAFHFTDAVQSRMVRLLSSYLLNLNIVTNSTGENIRLEDDFEVPQFAKCIYPLLVDLHDIFFDIPSIRSALACAQKMLCDVNKGEIVDNRLLSEVYAFQIAVEGLRIALNTAGRMIRNSISTQCEFSDLTVEDKSHAILAHALRSQAKKYKSIIAVVDVSGLAGLRKHWKTNVPPEVRNLVDQLVTDFENNGEFSTDGRKKWLLADKPMVAVGTGATAIVGASSLSKAVPVSTFIKITTLHISSSLKLLFAQTQKSILFAFGKTLGPTKMVAPGMKGSALKAAASAERIRMVAHSVIASVEKTSLSAMRTAFYEIMRKRRVRPVGVLPFATFGCSVATCAGLLVCGDGIECAAESFPAARSIASLGRGIQSLHEASRVVRPAERSRIQKSIESLLYKCKNMKVQ
ncbi:hypothetical protein OROHE_017745 [Orobanche hederae]